MKTATQPQTSKPTRPSSAKSVGRLYFLEASGGRIHSANADGSDRKVIVSGARVPDGVVVDVEAGHIYWTNMGVPSKNDGSIERVDLDGQNRVDHHSRRRARLRRSNSIWRRRAASFTGATAKECA